MTKHSVLDLERRDGSAPRQQTKEPSEGRVDQEEEHRRMLPTDRPGHQRTRLSAPYGEQRRPKPGSPLFRKPSDGSVQLLAIDDPSDQEDPASVNRLEQDPVVADAEPPPWSPSCETLHIQPVRGRILGESLQNAQHSCRGSLGQGIQVLDRLSGKPDLGHGGLEAAAAAVGLERGRPAGTQVGLGLPQ